jgi:hypothetical protein
MVRPVELVLTGVTGPTPSSTTLKNRTSFFCTIGATFGSFTVPFFLSGTLEESFAIALASFSASFLAFFSASICALGAVWFLSIWPNTQEYRYTRRRSTFGFRPGEYSNTGIEILSI